MGNDKLKKPIPETINVNVIHKGKIFDVKRNQIILNKKKTYFDLVSHKGAVAVVPLLKNKKIILVKQFRYAIKKELFEIPAGLIDKNESLVDCAYRELKEETGFKANKIEKLFQTFLSPGYSNELLTIFLASDLKKGEQSLDLDEFIEVKTFNFDEILNMIKNNEITDSKTISAILYMNLNDYNW